MKLLIYNVKLIMIPLFFVIVQGLDYEKIIGSQNNTVKIEDYGYYVMILGIKIRNSKYVSSVCGASIVHSHYAITAAHCLMYTQWRSKLYAVPSYLPFNREIMKNPPIKSYHKVVEAYVSPDWFHHENKISDIGVVKIKGEFISNEYPWIKPLRLPDLYSNHAGKKAVVTGRGKNTLGLNANGKLTKKTNVWDLELRATMYKILSDTTASRMPICSFTERICAIPYRNKYDMQHEANGIVSYGDSGGPLVIDDNILVGVLSGGFNYQPGVRNIAYFIKVSHYLEFLQKIIDGTYDRNSVVTKLYL